MSSLLQALLGANVDGSRSSFHADGRKQNFSHAVEQNGGGGGERPWGIDYSGIVHEEDSGKMLESLLQRRSAATGDSVTVIVFRSLTKHVCFAQ